MALRQYSTNQSSLPDFTTNSAMPHFGTPPPDPNQNPQDSSSPPSSGVTAGQVAGGLGAGVGIYGDLRHGGTVSDIHAGVSAAQQASRFGAFGDNSSAVNQGLAGLQEAYGIYQGIQRGGVMGYGGAAINAARLGSQVGAFGGASGAIGAAAGYAAVPLALYNFAENWRSGATGNDTLQGAEAGAAIGSVIPGVGTLVGAGVGAVVGAASSMFGPGREDPENAVWDKYAAAFDKNGAQAVSGASPSQNFQLLAGIFDSRGSSIPFYNQYGRMGEGKFMGDMTARINQAIQTGSVPPNATPQDIYSKVVEPWINSMSPGGWQDANTVEGSPTKAAVGNMLTGLIGQYQSGQITSQTPLGIKGQTVQMQPYVGASTPQAGGGVGAGPMPQNPLQHPLVSSAPTNLTHAASNKTAAGVPSHTGATMPSGPLRQYQLNDPTATGMIGADTGLGGASVMPSPVPQPPQTGTGGSTSPTGTASPASSPSADPGYGGLLGDLIGGGLGLYESGQATKQNNAAIGPVMQQGQNLSNAGNTLLNQSMQGKLTPAQQKVVDTSQQQGQTLINAATPVGQIAQDLMKQYQSGQLKPADQAQLDQQVQAAKAQVAQMLGPNADSTTAATYYSQIDQQALQTKQQMLNSYLATGNQEFDQWAATTQAGQQVMLQGQQYAVTQIDNTFQQALQASSYGGQEMLSALQLTMQQNTQVANAFQSYMGNLAKGFALQTANGAGGLSGIVKGLTGGSSSSSGTDLSTGVAASPDYGSIPGFNTSVPNDPGINDLLSSNSSYWDLPQTDYGSIPGYY
jgi:hypothetical protein